MDIHATVALWIFAGLLALEFAGTVSMSRQKLSLVPPTGSVTLEENPKEKRWLYFITVSKCHRILEERLKDATWEIVSCPLYLLTFSYNPVKKQQLQKMDVNTVTVL